MEFPAGDDVLLLKTMVWLGRLHCLCTVRVAMVTQDAAYCAVLEIGFFQNENAPFGTKFHHPFQLQCLQSFLPCSLIFVNCSLYIQTH